MARKRKSGLAEDPLVVASRAPWWMGLLLAALALLVLQLVASIEVRPAGGPAGFGTYLLLQAVKAIASLLRWVLPPLLVVAAAVSYFKQRRNAERIVHPMAATPAAIEETPSAKLDAQWDIEIRRAYESGDTKAPADDRPSEWTKDVLARMDWKRFEALSAAYYEHLGFRAETLPCGPDGGVDVRIFRAGESHPTAIVQCKAWTSRPVGVKPVRELLGVMVHNQVESGVFLTTSAFTDEAGEFAKGHRIALGTGDQLLARFAALSDGPRMHLLDVATEGDWTTPSCPSCGTKMVRREGSGSAFWGCASFPRCRRTFPTKPD